MTNFGLPHMTWLLAVWPSRNQPYRSCPNHREEGRSAHTHAISRPPVFKQLLDDASKDIFDVISVHTADRWARNTRVALNSVAVLAKHGVVLTAINGSLDYSTPEGRLFMTILSGFNEYFSDNLGTHTRKGVEGRASKSLHPGSLPFGTSPATRTVFCVAKRSTPARST